MRDFLELRWYLRERTDLKEQAIVNRWNHFIFTEVNDQRMFENYLWKGSNTD